MTISLYFLALFYSLADDLVLLSLQDARNSDACKHRAESGTLGRGDGPVG